MTFMPLMYLFKLLKLLRHYKLSMWLTYDSPNPHPPVVSAHVHILYLVLFSCHTETCNNFKPHVVTFLPCPTDYFTFSLHLRAEPTVENQHFVILFFNTPIIFVFSAQPQHCDCCYKPFTLNINVFCVFVPSVSQFCIGQSQLGHLRLTVFRYCVPTPYLSQVNTGLYKRMRWNVEKLHNDEEKEAETD